VVAVSLKKKTFIGLMFLAVALFFVYRSFYGMRIPKESA